MSLMYTSIRVKDVKKSVEFYKKMGLKVIGRRSPIEHELIVMMEDKKSKQRLNLMWYGKKCKWYTPYKMNGVELDHLMFDVKDAKKEFKRLVRGGAPVAFELMERDGRSFGMVKDPNGIWVGVASGVWKK